MTTTTTNLIPPSDRLGSTQEYYFSRKLREIAELRQTGHDILNLGIGSPDLPPAPAVIAALTEAAARPDSHGYQPYTGRPELRRAFADWYARYFRVTLNPDTEVLPLIGSKEGIMHISMAFVNPGDEILVPDPGYPTYRSATELAGGTVRPYALTAEGNWLPDLNALAATDLDRVKIMWVNYPHMPTGASAPPDFFAHLVDFARRHRILLVNDNPYAFILTERVQSILAIPGAREVALELGSLSKAQNMAGWRVGVLAGAPEYLQTVLRFKSNMDSGMFLPVQRAATVALGLGQQWYDELNTVYRNRREIAFQLLDILGSTYSRQQVGLFVWGQCPPGTDGFAVCDRALYDHNVFVTPGGIFGEQGRNYVRISLCSKEEQLKQALQRLGGGAQVQTKPEI
jgi:aspartate/methionine/tyrosine aminotransferase